MQSEHYRTKLSVSSWNKAFMDMLVESRMFEGTPSLNIHEPPDVVQFTQYENSSLEEMVGLVQNFWELEEEFYAAGHPRPYRDARGLRFEAKIDIWEVQEYTPFPRPKKLEGYELTPSGHTINGALSVCPRTSYQDGERSLVESKHRAILLSLHVDMRQETKQEVLNLLATPSRIARILAYYKQYYG
jgi:hypothetical protein